jgi:hypothetical protein
MFERARHDIEREMGAVADIARVFAVAGIAERAELFLVDHVGERDDRADWGSQLVRHCAQVDRGGGPFLAGGRLVARVREGLARGGRGGRGGGFVHDDHDAGAILRGAVAAGKALGSALRPEYEPGLEFVQGFGRGRGLIIQQILQRGHGRVDGAGQVVTLADAP